MVNIWGRQESTGNDEVLVRTELEWILVNQTFKIVNANAITNEVGGMADILAVVNKSAAKQKELVLA